MSGGLNPPKGRIWRDVDIHHSPVSGKTYAYVGAQSNGDLWIVDLSYLSTTTANGVDSNPIPPAGIANRGRTNYGHTMFVNDGLGLLFMNSANNASTLGCQIFDLLENPFDPPIIASWSGSGHDCHDSYARANVPGSGGKDLLYAADGYATRYRVIDITNVRTSPTTTLVGESAAVSGIYAHSNWLDDDSKYLFGFEEFNVRDISVFDVSNPASPTQVATFQYSGDATANSRIHNGQVRGKYLLTAYYEAGFRVFDISNPINPVEVGKYETWRDPDGDGTFNKPVTGVYNGAWNVHVFLPSGNVLVSDMKSGTFVFRVDPIPAPGTPSGLIATAGNGQVGLTWGAAAGATGYRIRRSTTAGGPYTIIANNVVGTSFTDPGVVNGTQYFYRVSATNAEGEGGSSGEASATPGPASTPTTTLVSSSPNPTTFGQSVTFTATVTSGSGVPAGSVTFTEGATVLASGVAVNAGGQASFSTTTLGGRSARRHRELHRCQRLGEQQRHQQRRASCRESGGDHDADLGLGRRPGWLGAGIGREHERGRLFQFQRRHNQRPARRRRQQGQAVQVHRRLRHLGYSRQCHDRVGDVAAAPRLGERHEPVHHAWHLLGRRAERAASPGRRRLRTAISRPPRRPSRRRACPTPRPTAAGPKAA